MKTRAFGTIGFNAGEVGYGAWGIGGGLWKGSDDRTSMAALHTAIEHGVNVIDTALAYNEGHSERLVGALRREAGVPLLIATKIPPKNRRWPAAPGTPLRDAFPADYIRSCTESSLRNLGVDAIDLQQFHVWSDEWAADAEWQDAVRTLQREGKVKHWGISINDHQPANAIKALETGLFSAVQVIYNIFDQSPNEVLLPYCQRHRIAVIVRVPLDEGGLTGTITPDSTFAIGDFRANYFRGDRKREVQDRVDRLRSLLGEEASTVPELALRFTLSHPAVSTIIPGMRTSAHVAANVAVSDGRTLSDGLLRALESHRWERNFYA